MSERVTHAHVVEGNDAMSLMIDVWLAGFLSGAGSGATTVFRNDAPAVADDDVDRWCHVLAHRLQDKMAADPLMVESIREQVQTIIYGQAAGARCGEVRVHVDDESAGGDGS